MRRAPWKFAGFRDVNDFVDHGGDRVGGIFHNASAMSNDGQHGVPLSAASILTQDDGVVLGEFDDPARCQERQAG